MDQHEFDAIFQTWSEARKQVDAAVEKITDRERELILAAHEVGFMRRDEVPSDEIIVLDAVRKFLFGRL